MPRITCKTPSSGRPIMIRAVGITASPVILAEAPDFTVPDEQRRYATRDPNNPNRAILPGEIFLLTILHVRNRNTTNDLWVEVEVVTEANQVIACPGRVVVPADDSAQVPVQGLSLFKRSAAGSVGDRLRIRAQTAGWIDVLGGAEEKASSEHILEPLT